MRLRHPAHLQAHSGCHGRYVRNAGVSIVDRAFLLLLLSGVIPLPIANESRHIVASYGSCCRLSAHPLMTEGEVVDGAI